jgi:hypothetical protein
MTLLYQIKRKATLTLGGAILTFEEATPTTEKLI